MRRSTALLAVSLLVLSCAPVSQYKPKGELVPYQGFHARLPSGLQVVVYEVPQVERFSLTVSYGSGSSEDPAGKEGLAHLVEHLLFRTAPRGSAGAPIWDQLTAAGWRFNASTDWDSTDYFVVGKPAELSDALRLEASRMREPIANVDEKAFGVERDVVLAEYRERFETNRYGAQLQWLIDGAFAGHAYGRPIGGAPDSLRTIRLADAQAWTKDRYVPENAVVVVVSPFKSRDVMRLVLEGFGELAEPPGPDRSPRVAKAPPLPPIPGEMAALAVHKAPVRQPAVWVGWAVPGLAGLKGPQGEAAATALERAFGALVFRTYGPNGRQKVESWGAFYFDVGGQGLLGMVAYLASASDGERVADLVRSAALELILDDDEGLEDGVDPLTVRDRKLAIIETRDQLLVDGYLELEDLSGEVVAGFLRATGDPDYLAGRRKNITATLNSDISSYAAENLKRARSVAVLVVPDANSLASSLLEGGANAGDAGRVHDDLEDGTWEAPGTDRVREVARPPEFAAVSRRVLPNGLTAILARRGSLPVAEVRLLLTTSASGTPELPAGTPAFALATNDARFAQRGANRVGAARWVAAGRETVHRVTRGSSANLEVLLESTAQWARDQKVRYYDEMQEVYLRWVQRREGDPDVVANDALLAAAFPGHPYSAPVRTVELARGGWPALDRYFGSEFRPERATLIVVSNQPPSPELWATVERHFGGWGRGSAPRRDAPEPGPAERRLTLVHRPGASQAVIGLALRVPPWNRRDRVATVAIAWLTGTRLMNRLRIAEGVTYGARVFLYDQRSAAALIVSAAVSRDATAHSLSTVLAAVKALAEGGVTKPEAARARWQVARRYATAFDTVAESAWALEEASAYGALPEVVDGDAASIVGLDVERVKTAAAALPIGQESIVIIGDAGVLLPQLEAAGFKPVVVKP